MNKSNTITSVLLKPMEAAQTLSISERTLFKLTKDGTIPSVRLGRSVRYDVDMLRNIITDQQTQSGDTGEVDRESFQSGPLA